VVAAMSTSFRCAVVLVAASRLLPRKFGNHGRSNSLMISVSGWGGSNPIPYLCRSSGSGPKLTGTRNFERTSTIRPAMTPDSGKESAKSKIQRPKSKKLQIAKDITATNLDKLAAAFDELARKEGFDASLQHFADDATFEDDFDENDYFDDDDEVIDDNSIDVENISSNVSEVADDALLDPMKFRLSDFSETNSESGEDVSILDNNDNDMDARIAGARKDMVTGNVQVPKQLDQFAADSIFDLSSLGYRTEDDPWGIDEKPRKKEFDEKKKEYQLVSDALICSACGADFQSTNENRPGFLPVEKFTVQVKLSKIEELQRLKLKAESDSAEWTPDDEVEWLIQSASGVGGSSANATEGISQTSAANLDVVHLANEMGLDLDDITKRKVICKRCHGLQNFGKVENVLRPGWTEEPLLSQEKFRDLLRPIREKKAVIIALVDLFDFSGSVLPELDNIAGDNPVILAANKADLLPAKMGQVRAENWVRRELEYMGIRSLANIGGAVRLVSCKTGVGVGAMLAKARGLADEMDCDIYVVGAANAGKSTLLNYILGPDESSESGEHVKLRSGNRNKRKSAVTTSPLPGTTLKFIKVDVGGGRSLYDTPGLLVPGTLTQLLTPEELKVVVPKK
jgi:50S ribosome-binding GTPase